MIENHQSGGDDGTAPVIAIDGPGSSGKGTVAAALARRLGWHLLDSGALYRAVGVCALKAGFTLKPDGNLDGLGTFAEGLDIAFDDKGHLTANGEDITDAIRTAEAGPAASVVAARPEVREVLHKLQRASLRPPGLIADGRDMGSVVFPEAILKIFLTAGVEERAKRRYKQLLEKGMRVNLPALLAELEERDERDRTRAVSPLVQMPDAVVIDSTNESVDGVVALVLEEAKSRELVP